MRKIVIVILLVIITVNAWAQNPSDNDIMQMRKQFNYYAANSLQEKVFVHTDKNAYAAGEILWFKIYDVDGTYMKPLGISKVAYIELLDHKQNVVLQTKVAMDSGMGNGSIFIPLTISTGNFILRAYTSWMKNFAADYYFSKQIAIYNTLKSPELNNSKPATAYDVQFFPEGGNLVEGFKSKVAFKVTDEWGRGVNTDGVILNQKNDTVVSFKSLKYGMGRFVLKPEINVVYHAILNIDGKRIEKELPAADKNGYVMDVTSFSPDKLAINISTTTAGGEVYLFVQTRGVIKKIEKLAIDDHAAHFTINKSTLGDGISQITIFNNERKPVCERLYFKIPSKELAIKTEPDAQEYGTRRMVTLSIGTETDTGATAANLSLTVYRLDSLQTEDQQGIRSYLWLRSDLRGYIQDPDYYFKNRTPEAQEAADNLMLTQGWRRFDWNEVLSGKYPSFNFLPEFNGPVITAKITDKLTGNLANGVIVYLGIPGKSVQLYTAKSNASGRLLFNMKNFYGPSEIVAETNTELDTTHHIDILTPFSEQFAKLPVPELAIVPAMQNAFAQANLNMQVQNIYNYNKLTRFDKPDADSSAFYGGVYNTYMLDLYTRFTTIEEIMREYVKEVNVIHLHNQFHIKVLNEKGFLHDGDPLVTVDGIPFFNLNKVFAIDPLKLQKLTDVPYGYYLGPAFEDGVFNFSSYKGDFGGAEIDLHAVVVDYEGLQLQREFYSPAYETAQEAATKMPDFRNVLYWSPSISTSTNGKCKVSFYTSDLPGKYIGVIQGINPDGRAGSKTFGFEVNETNALNKP